MGEDAFYHIVPFEPRDADVITSCHLMIFGQDADVATSQHPKDVMKVMAEGDTSFHSNVQLCRTDLFPRV